jgi:O-methyltransferase
MNSLKSFLLRRLPARVTGALRVLKNPQLYAPFEKVTYRQDGLVTEHNSDFMSQPRFVQAYRKGEETGSWNGQQIHWRAHVACWAAERVRDLEGDYVECGVNKGGLSLTVMEYIKFARLTNKTFYLLDTFEGLAEQYISAEEKELGRRPGGYDACYEAVKETFSRFENVVIIKGAVPDSLPQVKAEKVCYLSIDMNCMEPEIAAAEFFWDKLVSGAAMVLDDYGWTAHVMQKNAFDLFAERKRVPILSLPTGQGLILKP